MNQEIAISKIMTEIKDRHLISSYADSDIEYYLTIAIAIGFDLGYNYISGTPSKRIGKYNNNGKLIQEYQSIQKAAKLNEINYQNIVKAAKGKRPKAGGFYWRFL